MSDDSARPIVIKRKKIVAGTGHGGAWKIAYADFVTAMMAFFLLMWLLSSTSTGDLQGIADYFQNPLRVSMSGGRGVGDETSIIHGGGTDLSRSVGQVRESDVDLKKKAILPKDVTADQQKKLFEEQERERLKDLKKVIEQMIDNDPSLKQFKRQLLLDLTTEGLRIQIVDEQNRPMFDLSSAELKPYTRDILHEIGKALNGVPNRVSISGHTDAARYAAGDKGFSNWELSANRANASRRELVAGGMDDGKVLRVVGLSSTVLFDKTDPLNAINRRISIIVLNKRTEESFLNEGISDGDTPAVNSGAAAGELLAPISGGEQKGAR